MVVYSEIRNQRQPEHFIIFCLAPHFLHTSTIIASCILGYCRLKGRLLLKDSLLVENRQELADRNKPFPKSQFFTEAPILCPGLSENVPPVRK